MSFKRLVLIWIAIFSILIAGLIWTLNIRGLIKGDWSTFISAVFTVLSVLFAFLQWTLPSSPSMNNNKHKIAIKIQPSASVSLPSSYQSPTSENVKLKTPATFSSSDKDYERFRKQVKKRLSGFGAIIVFTEEYLINRPIIVNIHPAQGTRGIAQSNIERKKIGDKYICAAVLNGLLEGNYIVWLDQTVLVSSIPVFWKEVTVIDCSKGFTPSTLLPPFVRY